MQEITLPPQMRLKAISVKGIIEFTFSQPMQVISTLDVLKHGKTVDGLKPILEVKVIPGDFSEPKDLEFEWIPVAMSEDRLSLELVFDNPLSVSTSGEPEFIEVTLNDELIFMSEQGELLDF